jgi:hypothetical protein
MPLGADLGGGLAPKVLVAVAVGGGGIISEVCASEAHLFSRNHS